MHLRVLRALRRVHFLSSLLNLESITGGIGTKHASLHAWNKCWLFHRGLFLYRVKFTRPVSQLRYAWRRGNIANNSSILLLMRVRTLSSWDLLFLAYVTLSKCIIVWSILINLCLGHIWIFGICIHLSRNSLIIDRNCLSLIYLFSLLLPLSTLPLHKLITLLILVQHRLRVALLSQGRWRNYFLVLNLYVVVQI